MTLKPTLLLTGATGFLGSSILKKLLGGDFDIVILLRKSSSLARLESIQSGFKQICLEGIDYDRFFKDNHVDIILHCATDYGRKATKPTTVLEANLILPLKLLQLGAENGVSCFINTDTILDKGINYYALSKSQFKDWLRIYSQRMTCVNVALEHFYGPNDSESKFVTWLIRSLLKNESKIALTPGLQKRDFIYIDDVSDAFLRILSHGAKHGRGFFPYEIGSGKTVTIRDFAEKIKRLADNTTTLLDFGAMPYRKLETMDSFVDLTNIKQLGWLPRITLEDGLKLTISDEKRRLLP